MIRTATPGPLDFAWERALRLVDPRLGLVKRVVSCAMPSGGPRIALCSVEGARLEPWHLALGRTECGGAGFTLAQARLAAMGEFIEGYCAAIVPRAALRFGTYRELSRTLRMVAPERFALFSDEQHRRGLPFKPFTADSPVSWVEGTSLVTGEPTWVPASRVYMPFRPAPGEASIAPVVSTGLAAGPSREAAALSGLYECIERDAFTIFWLNGLSGARVDLARDVAPAVRDRFVRSLSAPGYRYHCLDITSDLGVPTMLVVLDYPGPDRELILVAAATRADASSAVEKALLEAAQGVVYIEQLIARAPDWRPAADYSNVTDFALSCQAYSVDARLRRHLLQLVEGARPGGGPLGACDAAPGAVLADIASRLRALGLEAVVVELTTPDVAQGGFAVVRVVTPELQPLHADHRYRFLAGPRLYEAPVRMGQRAEPLAERELNPLPHPFP